MYTFIDRVNQVAGLRGHRLVQLNLSLQLKGAAKAWYEVELGYNDKSILCEAPSIQAWINALGQRFRPSPALMLQQLEQTHYTRADAANKRDPVEFLHEILRLTRHDNRPDTERVTIAYIHFESQLRMNLIPPHEATGIPEFIEQLEAKKHAWYEAYQNFGKRKDPYPTNPAPSRPPYEQRAPQPDRQQPRPQQRQFQPKAYFVDPHEQATYAKHGGTVPRGYPTVTPSGRKTPPQTEEGDGYDYDEDYGD